MNAHSLQWEYIGLDQQLGVNLKNELLLKRLEKLSETKSIFVDFDETLFLRNSTELFLSQSIKSVWLSIVLQFFDLIKPWRWHASSDTALKRDLFRLKLILWLSPRSISDWERQAKINADKYFNKPLLNRLRNQKSSIYIVSFGMDFIIQPIVSTLKETWPILVMATPQTLWEKRQKRKAKLIEEQLGSQVWEKSMCITDSKLDSDLLSQTTESYLCQWPACEKVRAGLSPMLPFVYTKKVKRPDENYFTRAIIGHDYLTLLLVFALYNPHPFYAAVALLFYLLAYFSVYEIGYYENDKLGKILEKHPKISNAYETYAHHFKPWFAWFFGGIFTLFASGIVAYFQLSWWQEIPTFIQWTEHQWLSETLLLSSLFLGLLGFVRLIFHWFNRIDEVGRIVPMLFLQLARLAGYLLIFMTSAVGAIFLFSHALSKWIPYVVYRCGGSRPLVPNHLINFLLLMLLLLLLWGTHVVTLAQITEPTSLIILGYSFLRGTKDFLKFGHRLKLKPLPKSEVV